MNLSVPLIRAADCGARPDSTVEWLEHSSADVDVSSFKGVGGTSEWHVAVSSEGKGNDPVKALEQQWLDAMRDAGIGPESTVIRRVFCSDVANQYPQLDSFARAYPGGFSAIGQPPLAGGRFAMWSYHIHDRNKPLDGADGGERFTLRRGPLHHDWVCGVCDIEGADSDEQTRGVLEKYKRHLTSRNMTPEANVIRTWWYVRDIDFDYQGLVNARREIFARHGMTEDTHYIASTGIAGAHHQPAARLSLDSYAIRGLVPEQVRYLSAPDHLGPTHSYGVTFERATCVAYADRKHVFLSGTASINPDGEIVHTGDVLKQLDRALENLGALLDSAGAGYRDLAMMLVYLRDPADGPVASRVVCDRFAGIPVMVLHAAVCRPGWLVEVEGIACVSALEPDLPEF